MQQNSLKSDLKTDARPLIPKMSKLTLSSSSNSSFADSTTSSDSSSTYTADQTSPSVESSRMSSSEASCTTASTDVTSFSYNRLREDQDRFEDQWQRINRHLHFHVPENLENAELWKRLAVSLYEKIEGWKEEKLMFYKTSIWDFCILHTEDEIDQEIVEEFLKHMELEGLIGTSITNLDIGQERIEVSSNILKNSSRVFILNSPPFSQSGFHRLLYQESMMRKLRFQDWKNKIIPIHPSDEFVEKYKNKYPLLSSAKGSSLFGLSSTVGIRLGNRTKTIASIRRALTTDLQEINDKRRRRAKESFDFAIECIFKSKCKNLCDGLNDLKEQFQELNFSAEQLAQVCMECENLHSLQLSEGAADQMIRLDNCTEISIGPSFHFNISS